VQHEFDILAYLRSKPRHGQPNQGNNETKLDKLSNQIKNSLDSINESIPEMDEFVNQINNVFDAVNNGASKANLSISAAVGIYEKYRDIITTGVERLTWLEERNKNLNKTFKINSVAAADFANKLRGLNLQFGDNKLFKFAANINKLTGGFAKAITDDTLAKQAKFQSYITENLQLSDEAANSYALYAAGVGKSADEAIVQQNKLANLLTAGTNLDPLTAQSMITEEIASTSSDIRAQFSRFPGQLETAALKSRLLGVSLQKLYDIGKNTLDIESAVGNEIELQLLSGRKLLAVNKEGQQVNFMAAYRQAMITSDVDEQQRLLQSMLEKEGDTIRTNFMYREKMAESLGMSSEELLNAVEKSRIIDQYGLQDLAKLSFDDLKAQMATLEQQGYSKEGLDDLLKQSDTRTTSERYLESIDASISTLIKGTKINVAESSKAAGKVASEAEVFTRQFTQEKFTDAAAEIDKFAIATSLTITPISQLAEKIPAIGKAAKTVASKLKLIQTGLPTGATAVGEAVVTKQAVKDAILFDPQDQIVTVASTDRGQLENTVNNMMNGASSNTLNIDYNAMASAMAMAMSRVKLSVGTDYNTDTFLNA
tara:strand:- start:75 stop:1868 length:1794 start_codon:yes stop_codon:yes gene_type:complete